MFCGVFCFALCWPKKNKLDLMSVTTGDLSGLKFIGSGDGMGWDGMGWDGMGWDEMG